MRHWLFGRRDVKGVDCAPAAMCAPPQDWSRPPSSRERPWRPAPTRMVDDPPSIPCGRSAWQDTITSSGDAPVERPNPTRVVNGLGVEMFPQTPIVAAPAGEPIRPPAALLDPPPAEVIPVLEMLDIVKGPGGTFGRVSAKVRKRELDRIAVEHMHAGEPFIYLGRRFPGANG